MNTRFKKSESTDSSQIIIAWLSNKPVLSTTSTIPDESSVLNAEHVLRIDGIQRGETTASISGSYARLDLALLNHLTNPNEGWFH